MSHAATLFLHVRPFPLPSGSDKTFAIRITHENALPKDTQEVCIQCALLYTTAEGQRRIRMHTMSGMCVGDRDMRQIIAHIMPNNFNQSVFISAANHNTRFECV